MREDIDGAEAAYRAAISVDPGYANAHTSLGLLLKNVRKDIDGAEAAYRAAIAADPGHAAAHFNLGKVLHAHARQIKERGGDLAAAAALYDECAQLWGFSEGAEHEWTRGARADAAELRSAICPIDSLV